MHIFATIQHGRLHILAQSRQLKPLPEALNPADQPILLPEQQDQSIVTRSCGAVMSYFRPPGMASMCVMDESQIGPFIQTAIGPEAFTFSTRMWSLSTT